MLRKDLGLLILILIVGAVVGLINPRFLSPVNLANTANLIGRLHINISGCINACGHHHVGHIGILGVEKNGEEFYQITIGGRADEGAVLGTLLVERLSRRYKDANVRATAILFALMVACNSSGGGTPLAAGSARR